MQINIMKLSLLGHDFEKECIELQLPEQAGTAGATTTLATTLLIQKQCRADLLFAMTLTSLGYSAVVVENLNEVFPSTDVGSVSQVSFWVLGISRQDFSKHHNSSSSGVAGADILHQT